MLKKMLKKVIFYKTGIIVYEIVSVLCTIPEKYRYYIFCHSNTNQI